MTRFRTPRRAVPALLALGAALLFSPRPAAEAG